MPDGASHVRSGARRSRLYGRDTESSLAQIWIEAIRKQFVCVLPMCYLYKLLQMNCGWRYHADLMKTNP